MVATVESLLQVRRIIRDCNRCALRSECACPVPPRGPAAAELLVLGEAPGKMEDEDGRPFVGPAGMLLRGCLDEAGIDHRKLAYANPVNCYPSRTRTPTPDHLAACQSNLHMILSAWAPSIILAMGRVAISSLWPDLKNDLALLHRDGVRPMIWDQKRHLGHGGGRVYATVWPTYHPASALKGRNPHYRDIIVEDMKALVHYHKTLGGKGEWPSDCWVCGEELYVFDDRGLALCQTHAATQGQLPI